MVTQPLGLLEKNLEFVDSPGLNDTEERNRITFDYLPRCHAVLFVLSAVQPFTRTGSYLQEHLAGRGYTIFFLVNFWNQVKDMVLRPEDLAQQEAKLRRLLREQLARHARRGEEDRYEQRVFGIDALGALRGRLAAPAWTRCRRPAFLASWRLSTNSCWRNGARPSSTAPPAAPRRPWSAWRRRRRGDWT